MVWSSNMRWTLALLIILLTILLRLPTLLEPPWYGDEGIFAAVAAQMNRGSALYKETFDNKPPLIYLIYALPFALFGPKLWLVKLLALLSVAATQVLLYKFARRLAGRNAALVSTALFGLSASLPLLESSLALTETFLLPLTTSAFYLAYSKPKFIIWVGFLISLSFLLKPIFLIEGISLFIYVLLFSKINFKQKIAFLIGLIILPIVWAGYFWLIGSFPDFLFASILFYTGYLQWTPAAAQSPFALLAKLSLPTLGWATLWILYYRQLIPHTRQTRSIILILFWVLASWTAALFSGRPYNHYLIETLPATILAFTSLIFLKGNRKEILLRIGLAVIVLYLASQTARVFPTFASLDNLPSVTRYYQNFWDFIRGQKDQAAYNTAFDATVNRNLRLVTYLSSHTQATEPVYIWGEAPWIYALAPIINPSRYVVSFHVLEIRPAKEQTLRELTARPPTLFVVINSLDSFKELRLFLYQNYRLRTTLEDAQIWERL